MRGSLKLIATSFMRPLAKWRLRQLGRLSPARLHLGCGGTLLAGWINVDLVGQPANIHWDLRHRLPIPDGSVDAVFHEHLLEHLPLPAALPLLRESRRLLRSGGILRVGVPDVERYIRDYVELDGYAATNRPNRPTRLLALGELVYGYQHRSLWDRSTLCLALQEVGFEHVSVRPFGDSAIEPAPDSPKRAAETLYVEGLNP